MSKTAYYFGQLLESTFSQEKRYETSYFLDEINHSQLIKQVFPELVHSIGVDGGSHHREAIFDHLIECLCAAQQYGNHNLNWAALLHDIGKPFVREEKLVENNKIITFYNHEIKGAELTFQILTRFGIDPKRITYITNLVRNHMWHFPKTTKKKTIRKWLFQIGKNSFEDLIKLRICDRLANKAKRDRPVITEEMQLVIDLVENSHKENLVIFPEDLKISRADIAIRISNTININEVLSNIVGMVNREIDKNNREYLIKYIEKHYPKKEISSDCPTCGM